MLRILGPSSLTLYKHVLGRRRILIYTLPPVEAACILCQVAADMCYEAQQDRGGDTALPGKLKGRCKEPINVLGMVTLSDMDRMRSEGSTGRGWIACTSLLFVCSVYLHDWQAPPTRYSSKSHRATTY